MNNVLVIGGHIQGLGIVRCLGSNGIPVLVADWDSMNVARFSKYCTNYIALSDRSSVDDSIFIEDLIATVRPYVRDSLIVFATDDRTIMLLSRSKKQLISEGIIPIVPDWDVTEKCYDKRKTAIIASEIRLPAPDTYFLEKDGDLGRIGREVEYPCIVKPAIMHKFYKITKQKALVARDWEELQRRFHAASKIIPEDEIMVQTLIPGGNTGLFSCGSYRNSSGRIISQIARRERQIPLDFGKASTYVRACENEEIENRSIKILNHINYCGISEVEFKQDERDGDFKLLEINPRTWKWFGLLTAMGMNLPMYAYKDAISAEPNDLTAAVGTSFNNGIWIDILADTYISITGIIQNKIDPTEFMNSLKGPKTFSSLSKMDPLPFLMEVILSPHLARR